MRSSIRFTVALQLAGLATAVPNAVVTARDQQIQASNTYDYVIVGGGITGLIVANRLTEDSNSKFISV
jgi:ribulose 1,5-bisphosphate synthetase/thiazole synthase